jgi:DNA invertase Pin-like site-specific DNA recombinase
MIRYIGYHPQPKQCGGRGLFDQKSAIEKYAREHSAHIAAYYHEDESPKKRELPSLARALTHAKQCNAALIVARLDRLAHNVSFLSAVVDAGVAFIACDTPEASSDSLPILLAVAKQDARRISERTRAAFARRPKRVPKGTPANLTDKARRKGARSTRNKAWFAYHSLSATIEKLRDDGRTLREIADHLNTQGYKTRQGCRWNHNQVKRVLDRYATGR